MCLAMIVHSCGNCSSSLALKSPRRKFTSYGFHLSICCSNPHNAVFNPYRVIGMGARVAAISIEIGFVSIVIEIFLLSIA